MTLSSVHLQDPSAGFAPVPGTSTSIDGGRFTVTGFAGLEPGKTYELVLVLSEVPPDGYDVDLRAID